MKQDEVYEKASNIINRARKEPKVLMEQGLIATPKDKNISNGDK